MQIHQQNLTQTFLQAKVVGILVSLAVLKLISNMFPILPKDDTPDHYIKFKAENDFINMGAEIRGLFDEATYTSSNLTRLREEIPDVIDALPDRYLENYKSFCWFDKTNKAQLLCLPRVYLGGFIKCGTSEIHRKLSVHYEINPGEKKEHKWWSRYRIPHQWRERNQSFQKEPFSHYLQRLQPEKMKNNTVLFDGSATLLWHQLYWEERFPLLNERPYSNADLIRIITPDAKILVIVRNPTERLWSGYLFYHAGKIGQKFPMELGAKNLSPEGFDQAVRNEIARFRDCVKGKGLRRCCFDTKHLDRYDTAVVTLTLGIYVCYIREWKEKFSDQLRIIRLEDFTNNPTTELMELYKFFDVSPRSRKKIDEYLESHGTKNVRRPENIALGDMLGSTRQLLNSFYRPFNQELAKLMNDDRFLYE